MSDLVVPIYFPPKTTVNTEVESKTAAFYDSLKEKFEYLAAQLEGNADSKLRVIGKIFSVAAVSYEVTKAAIEGSDSPEHLYRNEVVAVVGLGVGTATELAVAALFPTTVPTLIVAAVSIWVASSVADHAKEYAEWLFDNPGTPTMLEIGTAFNNLWDASISSFQSNLADDAEALQDFTDEIMPALNLVKDTVKNFFADQFVNGFSSTDGAWSDVSSLLSPFVPGVDDVLGDLTPQSKAITHLITAQLSTVAGVQLTALQNGLGIATQYFDPLVFDLDGDGVELSNMADSTAFFDLDGDGMAEHMGWVDADDGILALDRNNNGIIDNASEVFGATSISEYSVPDGYAALAKLDSNNDGVIDSNDAQFADLRIWQDANQDGISQASELKTLAELNITSISLSKSSTFLPTNANLINYTSSFTRTDSSTGGTANVWFAHSLSLTHYNGDYDLSLAALVLPALRGYGQVKDLTIAMSMDSTLLGMVQTLTGHDIDYIINNQSTIDSEIDAILYRWAGVQDITSSSRGGVMDARQLGFIEHYLNTPYVQDTYNPNPTAEAALTLQNAWEDLRSVLKAQLLFQSGLGALLPDVSYDMASDSFVGTATIDTDVLDEIQNDAAAAPDVEAFWQSLVNSIKVVIDAGVLDSTQQGLLNTAIQATDSSLSLTSLLNTEAAGANVITGTSGDETLNGTSANDNINALGGNNTLNGLGGNDRLSAGDGNNVFNGGTGYNTMLGGTGDDIYIVGQGRDIIRDMGGNDELQFVSGITASDLTISRYGDRDLVIEVSNGAQVIFNQHFMAPANVLETVRFSDNSTLDLSSFSYVTYGTSLGEFLNGITANGLPNDTIYGAGGNDQIYGLNGDDYLDGGADNDILFGAQGNDTLVGGLGNNALLGGSGDDVYMAGPGHDVVNDYDPTESAGGTDTIQFGAGVTLADLSISRSVDNSLLISVAGGGSIEVINQFIGESAFQIEQLRFSDNSTVDLFSQSYVTYGTEGNESIRGITTSVGSHDDMIYGFSGNDQIYAGDGNDTLSGGSGDNGLYGGSGDDIYIVADGYNFISDYDSYESYGGSDAIQFGTGVTLEDLTLTRTNTDSLLIAIAGGGTVEVQYQFNQGTGFQIEQLRFADNSTFNLLGGSYATYGDSGDNYINGTITGGDHNDIIYGLGGSDQIYAGDGNDTLIGGAGNDILRGGSGDDVYVVGEGNDVINDYDPYEGAGGTDTIQFGSGVTLADLTFVHTVTDSLLISIAGGASVEIQNQFNVGTGYQIEQLRFADNSTYDLLSQSYVTYGSSGDEFINGITSGGGHNDIIYGLGGNDQLFGRDGDDYLDGGADNDVLFAGGGNDTLVGGSGNDGLLGGSGDDVYIAGEGNDVINDYDPYEGAGGTDTIQFGSGVTLADLTFVHTVTDSLLISIAGGASVEIQNQFNIGTGYQIEQLRFADNSILDLLSKSYVTYGTEGGEFINGIASGGSPDDTLYGLGGNDAINGGNGNDSLYGGADNDVLYGGSGNDILSGDAGDDVLRGGSGDDVYIVGEGNDIINDYDPSESWGGFDTIQLGTGITAADLTFIRTATDSLLISIAGGSSVEVQSEFNSDIGFQIEQLRFADSSTLDLLSQSYTTYGTENGEFIGGISTGNNHDDVIYAMGGNDIVYGGIGNDTISGGTGYNQLHGDTGDDVYLVGEGNDLISDYDPYAISGGVDTIQFGDGITLSDMTFGRSLADSLIISIAGGSSVELQYQFNNISNYQVEQLRLTDGTTLNLLTQSYSTYGTEGGEFIFGITSGGLQDETIYAMGGNDYVYARAGNDTIIGGAGDDTLYGESGDDTYIFARGDGADVIVDSDSTSGNHDTLKFASTIDYDQLWLSQSGNDLQISVIGTRDSTMVANWFADTSYHIEEIDAGGMKLLDSQVSALVTAMASYTAPSMGQTTMPTQLRSDLDTALAAAWQSAA